MSIRCQKCDYNNPPDTRFCGGCGTRLGPSTPSGTAPTAAQTQTIQTGFQELQLGSLFAGRYLVLESLGRGGMGRVYRVLDKKLDVEIALKLLRPEVAADAGIIERFKNELKLARTVSHPHVCRMYDLSEDQGTHFITMEYVPGEDLKTTVRRVGPLGLNKALSIAKQIADGLAAAHKLDIIHRDLKPQNIMLDRKGQVRIMDFGISRSLRAKGITADGMMIGTPEYISPEQAEGKKVDARTDIYAFGVILFEMVTGQVPFEGDTTLSIILKHKLEPPPDPKKLNPGLPKDLGRIILKCLEKSRERRFSSAQALYAELDRVEKQLEGKGQAKPEEARSGRRRFAIPVLVLAAAAVLVAGYFLLKPSGPKPASTKTARAAEVLGPSADSRHATAPPVPAPKPDSSLETEPPPVVEQKKESKTESKTEPRPKAESKTAMVTAKAPATGILEISTVPPGVDIYLDGELAGTSPLKQVLKPGAHGVRVQKPSEYKEVADQVTVRAGASLSKNYVLTPVFVLEVRTVPPGADLHVDGVSRGKTPAEFEVSNGNVQFGLSFGDDWIPISEALKLHPGRNVVERVLQRASRPEAKRAPPKETPAAPPPAPPPRPGQARINVLPYAEVFIDGKSIGEVPPVKTLELAAGVHPLKFDSPRLGKSLSMSLTVKPDDRVEVRVNMVSGDMKVLPWKEGTGP